MRFHHHHRGHPGRFFGGRSAMPGFFGFDPDHFGFDFGGGPRGHGRGGHRGRKRMFESGELRLVLLKLLADQPRHGYELIKAIEELTGGAYAPSPGVVYPTLTLLADMDLIREGQSADTKKVYETTDEGRAELDRGADLVAKLIDRLTATGEERRSSPHRQMHRAMENLRNAVRFHMGAGAFEDRVEGIVDILDEAAKKIERLD